MPLYSKDSLETLRQRIDLVEVASAHLDLKRAGASYKANCPFHDEKTPSFMIQKGDTHFHCFGCGAHGDAIQFLMMHLKMSFTEAVESLAQQFHLQLEVIEGTEEKKGANKASLKEALEQACRFYQFYLLHTEEGHQALHYLYSRGIDLDFIRRFRIGFAPDGYGMLRKVLHAKFIRDDVMSEAGLIAPNKDGGWRDFFQERITFPIFDSFGTVIGFSARKYKEKTFGGKYINTSETALFKKSRILFGLNFSRKRIAKERKAIIVEGQIDALRLIQCGYDYAVAGQGTAFGEGHARELLSLGLNQVFLALDSDEAGQEANVKIGHLFQKEGVEVKVLTMPQGADPDSYLRENNTAAFQHLLDNSVDYLSFLFRRLSRNLNMDSPAAKNEIVQTISKQIRTWSHSLMVHESLKKLAHLAKVPETMIGVGQEHVPNLYIKKSSSIGLQTIDPDRIFESDFLRWLLLEGASKPHFVDLARLNIAPENLRVPACRLLYKTYLEGQQQQDFLSLAIQVNDLEAQTLLSDLMHKKVNKGRSEQQYLESIQKILDRDWMQKREEIKVQIQSGNCPEEEVLALAKKFDEVKGSPPKIIMSSSL